MKYSPTILEWMQLILARVIVWICSLVGLLILMIQGSYTRLRYGPLSRETLLRLLPACGIGSSPTPIVYLHGGGWCIGSKECWAPFLRFFNRAGYTVYVLNYPLAPEAPYPKALQSIMKALVWVKENHPACQSVILAGDSAGGNLALMAGLSLCNPDKLSLIDSSLRKDALPSVEAAVSIYGILDRLTWIRNGFPKSEFFVQAYGGPKAANEELDESLVLTPMDAPFEKGPRTFVVAAGRDPLASSSVLCTREFQEQGQDFHYRCYPGQIHGFFQLPGSDAGKQLREDILHFLEGGSIDDVAEVQ